MIDPTKTKPAEGIDGLKTGGSTVTPSGYSSRPEAVKPVSPDIRNPSAVRTVKAVRGNPNQIRIVYHSRDGDQLFIMFRDGREFQLHSDELRAAIDAAQEEPR